MPKNRNIKIVGHRGARGHETENTIESLKKAMSFGVDMVEFDVWTSRDGVPFLLHDHDFRRIANHNERIFAMNSGEIMKLKTTDGKKIITAKEALKILKNFPLYFEIKDYYLTDGVFELLKTIKGKEFAVGSNNHNVLVEIKKRGLDVDLFAGTVWHPLETLRMIRKNGFSGLSLQYRWFSPLIYLYCKRYNIKLMLYTVNTYWHLKHLMRWYPGLWICSDYPDRAKRALAEVSR